MKRFAAVLFLAAFLAAPIHSAEPEHGRGYKPLPPAEAAALHAAAKKRHGDLMQILVRNVTPPARFDCIDLGIVPPIVDQGSCGSCYLVSSADAATAAWIKGGWGKNDGSLKISDQFGLDCENFGGCGGGDEAEVIAYMKDKGFPAEKYIDLKTGSSLSDYGPYKASPGRCQLKSDAKRWQLKDWGYVNGNQSGGAATLEQHKVALMTYGVVSIALDAGAFSGYSSGVITRLGTSVDHAITEVGWDDNKDCGDGTKGALHVRNNWGTGWGEKGYAWIAYSQVSKIVEPIWLLAPSVAPPPPPPPPPVNVPVITSPTTAVAQVNTPFSFQVVATNTPSVFLATGLPTGLTISTSGLISGTPTATGVSSVTLVAANGAGAGTQVLTITVGTTPPPPPPPPGGPVTVVLTQEQVISVLQQAGLENMTLKQLNDLLKPPPSGPEASTRKLEKELREQREALTEIMRELLKQRQKKE